MIFGSVSKVEIATPMDLIYKVLFPSISTFETPPERHIDPEQHAVGKQHTQKIESKPINLRTRIKRLVRRTICFSKTEYMHDLMIGLFINRYEFGRLL
jgi:hypothetical protein